MRSEDKLVAGMSVLVAGLAAAAEPNPWLPYHLLRISFEYISYFGVYLGAIALIAYWLRENPPRSDRPLVDKVLGRWFPGDRSVPRELPLWELVRGILLLAIALSAYTNLKVRYPFLNPARGDAFFMDWERDAGLEPIAQAVIAAARESTLVFDVLQRVYTHDYVFVVALAAAFLFRGDRKGLRIVFAGTALTYLSALLISTALPSFGPVFVFPERFEWMPHGDISMAQGFLRSTYSANLRRHELGEHLSVQAFQGIAAFPSLHVGHMAFVAIVSGRKFPVLTTIAWISVVLTTCATVAFGWHWVVDAPAGIVVAWFGASITKRIVGRDSNPADPQPSAEPTSPGVE